MLPLSLLQLGSRAFDGLIHSPLGRATETAQIVWGSRGGPPATVPPALREIDLYAWQVLMRQAEIETKNLFAPAVILITSFVVTTHLIFLILCFWDAFQLSEFPEVSQQSVPSNVYPRP